MAIVKDIFVDRNSLFSKIFTFFDENNAPFDLSNYNAYSQIKKSSSSTEILANANCSIISPATDGKLLYQINANSLLLITPGKYQYDILLVNKIDSNTKIRAVQGTVDINGNITNYP